MSNLTSHLKAMRSEVPVGDGDMVAASFGQEMLLNRYVSLRDSMPDKASQIFDMRYQDLMDDPMATVAAIYSQWGLPFSEEAQRGVRAYIERNPQGRHGVHQYSFGDTGLDLAEERAKFAAYQARFGVPSEV